jgi:acyl carrier protein
MDLNRIEVLEQVNKIFVELLDNEEIHLDEKTTSNDVEGWDSLIHIHLAVAMEKHFKIRFNSKEIQAWSNVGDIIDSILSKFT